MRGAGRGAAGPAQDKGILAATEEREGVLGVTGLCALGGSSWGRSLGHEEGRREERPCGEGAPGRGGGSVAVTWPPPSGWGCSSGLQAQCRGARARFASTASPRGPRRAAHGRPASPPSDLPSRKLGIQKVGSSYDHGEPPENSGDGLFMSFS